MKVWAAYDKKGLIEVFTVRELAEKAHPGVTIVERDLHGFLTAHEDLRPHHNIPLPKIPSVGMWSPLGDDAFKVEWINIDKDGGAKLGNKNES